MSNRYYQRGFLNEKEGMAMFEAVVYPYENDSYLDGYFSLTDCNHKVQLDFCSYNSTEVQARLNKVDLLIEQLLMFRTALEEAGNCMELDKEAN